MIINGTDGNDTLTDSFDADTMVGGLGNDTFVVNSTVDVVTEALNAGTDLVQSTAVAHTLSANVENLTLLGAGNLNGTGHTLNNVLTGNAGDNVLDGQAGTDTGQVRSGWAWVFERYSPKGSPHYGVQAEALLRNCNIDLIQKG